MFGTSIRLSNQIIRGTAVCTLAAWVASCGVEGNENETQNNETRKNETLSASQHVQNKQSGQSGFNVTGDGDNSPSGDGDSSPSSDGDSSQSGSDSYGGIYHHPSYVDACKNAGYPVGGDGIFVTKPLAPTIQPSDSGVFWNCYYYYLGSTQTGELSRDGTYHVQHSGILPMPAACKIVKNAGTLMKSAQESLRHSEAIKNIKFVEIQNLQAKIKFLIDNFRHPSRHKITRGHSHQEIKQKVEAFQQQLEQAKEAHSGAERMIELAKSAIEQIKGYCQ